MLRANGAALIGSLDKRADCRGIRRKRQLAATANRAALPQLEWTAGRRPEAIYLLFSGVPQCSVLAL
jgi:hypothetical protein